MIHSKTKSNLWIKEFSQQQINLTESFDFVFLFVDVAIRLRIKLFTDRSVFIFLLSNFVMCWIIISNHDAQNSFIMIGHTVKSFLHTIRCRRRKKFFVFEMCKRAYNWSIYIRLINDIREAFYQQSIIFIWHCTLQRFREIAVCCNCIYLIYWVFIRQHSSIFWLTFWVGFFFLLTK